MPPSRTKPRGVSFPFPSPSPPPPAKAQPEPGFPTPGLHALVSKITATNLSKDEFFREVLQSDLKLLDKFWSLFAQTFGKSCAVVPPPPTAAAISTTPATTATLTSTCVITTLKKMETLSSLKFTFDVKQSKRYVELFVVHEEILEKIYGDLDIDDLEYSVEMFAKPWQLHCIGVLRAQLTRLRWELCSRDVDRPAWSPTYSIELFGTLHSGAYNCFRLWITVVKEYDNGTYKPDERAHSLKNGKINQWVLDSTINIHSIKKVMHPLYPARVILCLPKDEKSGEESESTTTQDTGATSAPSSELRDIGPVYATHLIRR